MIMSYSTCVVLPAGEDGSDTDASVDEEEESGAPSPPLLTANSTTGNHNQKIWWV